MSSPLVFVSREHPALRQLSPNGTHHAFDSKANLETQYLMYSPARLRVGIVVEPSRCVLPHIIRQGRPNPQPSTILSINTSPSVRQLLDKSPTRFIPTDPLSPSPTPFSQEPPLLYQHQTHSTNLFYTKSYASLVHIPPLGQHRAFCMRSSAQRCRLLH